MAKVAVGIVESEELVKALIHEHQTTRGLVVSPK
jgi:hypothetical protein